MKIRTKITSAFVASALVIAVALTVVLMRERRRLSRDVYEADRGAMLTNLSRTAELLRQRAVTHDMIGRELLAAGLNAARYVFTQPGKLTLGKNQVAWTAVNQIDKHETKIQLPEFMIGGRAVSPRDASDVGTRIVDEAQKLSAANVTIFQRMNPEGDMLRIATNVLKADGSRAVGTYIPKESPVAQAVLRGETYRGRAFVVDKWYFTMYEPLKDGSGELIGMLYVGFPEQRLVGDIIKTISEVVVGKKGYVVILSASAEEKGKFIHHPNPALDGKAALDVKDADGNPLNVRFIEGAVGAGGKPVNYSYPWIDPDGKRRSKVAAAIYFEPWKWVIVATSYEEDFLESAAQIDDELGDTEQLFLLVTFIALGLCVIAALLFARAFTSPIRRSVDVLQAVAEGDFTVSTELDRHDELGDLARAIDQTVTGVRNALSEVQTVSIAVASAAGELAGASQEISSGAQEQASSLEESAASIEEMTATIKQSADHARQASQLALASRDAAEKGGQVVDGAVAAMSEINQASKQIAEIITAVDEIAFQTNLLALNAAVEAARAGEQGRGFAVVAAEVRTQRSATASKEIKGLIQDSVKKVESGSALVNQSGQTLDEIVASVKRVTDLVGDMASAAREQSTGIDQINRAVAQMDQVTQGNAAQTEEMSATAQGLTDQAEQLRALVARFRLSTESSRAAPDRPRATSASARRAVARRPAKVVRRALPAATFGHEGDGHDGNGRDRNGYHGNAHSRRAGTAVESLTSELGGEDTFNEA